MLLLARQSESMQLKLKLTILVQMKTQYKIIHNFFKL